MRYMQPVHKQLMSAVLIISVALPFVCLPEAQAEATLENHSNQVSPVGPFSPIIIDNDLPGMPLFDGRKIAEAAGESDAGKESKDTVDAGTNVQVEAAGSGQEPACGTRTSGPDSRKIAAVVTDLTLVDESEGAYESAQPIVIDNDEEKEAIPTIAYEELETVEGGTKIKAGARFPVVVVSQVSSKTAKKGDVLEARLKYDLKIGNRLIASRGDRVVGHLTYSMKARSIMHSLVSYKRWYRNSGALGITLDEIVTQTGEHLPLLAKPAQKARIIKNKGEGRVLGVNHEGIITGPWGQQLRYKAIRIGLNAALAPAGVFSFGAMPVALGVLGAVNPSFAFSKPVGLNVRHRRLKGFAWGFLSGVPGSWIIEDTVVKGQECIIKPGDEFLAEFKEEFTGEAATAAMLLPGATTSVHGQIENGKGKVRKVNTGRTKVRKSKKSAKLSGSHS